MARTASSPNRWRTALAFHQLVELLLGGIRITVSPA
jgi:hypothetical protein